MSKSFKIVAISSLSLLLVLIFLFISRPSKQKVYLWIEAENANQMEFPVEIFPDKECSNGKGITIREGAGVGFLGAPGSADYSFHIPKKGEYTIWFRARWEDGCANSFYASIDQHDYPINNEDLTHSVGNQNNYHHWFWIPGAIMSLDKGHHTLRIRNREDGIELDKILITNDADTQPEGFDKLSFILRDFKGTKLIQKGKNYLYQDFYAEADLADLKPSSVFTLLFSYQDDRNFNELTLKEGRLSVSRGTDGKRMEISSKEISWPSKASAAHLSCYFLKGQLGVDIDGKEILSLNSLENKEGFTDFSLKKVQLNRAQVIPIVPISWNDNFYDSAWNFSANPLGWKELTLSDAWFAPVEEGFPYQYQIPEGSQTSETAITITGEKWWRNYQYEVYAKGSTQEGFALLFYYADENNYYALWCKPAEQAISLFSKNEGTKNEIYRTSSENYFPDQWNKFQIQIFEGNIKILLNEKEIGTVQDRSLASGMIGLAAKGVGKVLFDEVSVQSLSGQNQLTENVKTDPSTIAMSDLFDFIEPEYKDTDDIALNQLSKLFFGEDLAPLKKHLASLVNWHIASGDWQLKDHQLFCSESQAISLIWLKHVFFGRLRIDFDFTLEKDTSELSFGLYDEDREVSKEIRFTPAKIGLLNNLKEEEALQGKIKAGQKHHAQIETGQDGMKIWIDSETIGHSALETNPIRLRPFFWTTSGKIDIDNFIVRTFPEYQYTFSVLTNAIEDFYDWQKDSTGWSISFADLFKGLRGQIENDQDIRIWNRRSFPQDKIAIETTSRIYSRGKLTDNPFNYERGIVFCSNGSPKNGYTVRVSLSNIELFRNGEKVASSPVRNMDLWNWNSLKVKKDSDAIRVYITDQFGHDRLGLEYQDAQPLTGERIGLELSGPDGLQVIFRPVRIYTNPNESS